MEIIAWGKIELVSIILACLFLGMIYIVMVQNIVLDTRQCASTLSLELK